MTDFYSVLPHLNATLNASSFVLLSSGYYFIRRKRVLAHRTCQLAALTASGDYDTHVGRLVHERHPIKVVNAQEAIDDYDKWHALYKKLIVDRSQH